MYYVYLLKSDFNQSLYVGSTKKLLDRVKQHNDGTQFSTRRYRPWKLIYYEAYQNEQQARQREKALKHHGNAMRELKKRIGINKLKGDKKFLRGLKGGAGFTLMEIIIVVAIFSITVVVAIDLFLTYTKLQKRASVEQTLGSDARFITESVARQFRLGTIDYNYYADPDGDPFTSDAIAIGATPVKDTSGNSILAIVDQGGGKLRYRFQQDANGVGRIELCSDTCASWATITPNTIDVDRVDFYLAPSRNPFQLIDPIPQVGSKYYSNEQPRLTIVLQTTSLDEKPPVVTNFQTTIVSRLYVR